MKLNTRDMVICALFASLTAALSQIAIPIPFTTVPLTMQVFAVALTGVVLGHKKAIISILIYMLMGIVGIPVFAHFNGGLHVIVGYTGGFILAFPLMVTVIGYVSEKSKKYIYIFMSMIVALIIAYLLGCIQYSFLAGVGFKEAFVLCVLPFIPVDLIKVVLATTVGINIKKKLKIKD